MHSTNILDGCLFAVNPKGENKLAHTKIMAKNMTKFTSTHTHKQKKTYRIYGYETLRVCSRRQQKSINQTRNDYCCEILQTNHTYCSRTHAHISKWLLTTRRWQWSQYNDYQNFQRHIVHPKRLLATPNQNKCLDPIVRKRARAAFASLFRTYASMKFIHLRLSICSLEQIHKIIFQHNHCH